MNFTVLAMTAHDAVPLAVALIALGIFVGIGMEAWDERRLRRLRQRQPPPASAPEQGVTPEVSPAECSDPIAARLIEAGPLNHTKSRQQRRRLAAGRRLSHVVGQGTISARRALPRAAGRTRRCPWTGKKLAVDQAYICRCGLLHDPTAFERHGCARTAYACAAART